LKPDWSKGYSRKGAALHGLGDFIAASSAYKEGLKIEPGNALLQKGLKDVEKAMEDEKDTFGGIANLFGNDVYAKMAANPRLAPFLAQPDIMAKIEECRKDPKNMSKYRMEFTQLHERSKNDADHVGIDGS
jgi:stress-induced-phosphoprotein 1